jgi:hypothetical protein
MICVIGLVRVASQKPVLDALHNDSSEVGCVNKVILKLRDELVAPSWTRVAEVQVSYGLGLVTRSAKSAFPNADRVSSHG